MRPCVSGDISRASSRIFPATPIRACLMAGRKAANTKSPPLAVKKVRLTPVQKKITLFSIGRCQTDGMIQSAVFLPPKAAFFTAAGRFLNHAGCCRHARHGVGGRRRRQGGKLVFRLPSPTATKRRSRQHPPWLFVFISTYYISR